MPHRMFHLSVLAFLLMPTALVRAGDVPKSADHPLIKRYEGSTIVRYAQKAFDEYALVVGPVEGRGSDAHFPKTLKLEGRVTRITYLVPEGRSPLEVARNYELEMKKAGFTTLFAGAHEALGQGADDTPFPEARVRRHRFARCQQHDAQHSRVHKRSIPRRKARPTTGRCPRVALRGGDWRRLGQVRARQSTQ